MDNLQNKCSSNRYSYQLIDHTSDIGVEAYGETLPEAFLGVAAGMFSIITNINLLHKKQSLLISIQENSLEDLLFEWLNSLLYYFDTSGFIPIAFDIISFNDTNLKIRCHGEHIDPVRHELGTGIKSATYHLLKVDATSNMVRVYFDL